jgi:hypothetical protein
LAADDYTVTLSEAGGRITETDTEFTIIALVANLQYVANSGKETNLTTTSFTTEIAYINNGTASGSKNIRWQLWQGASMIGSNSALVNLAPGQTNRIIFTRAGLTPGTAYVVKFFDPTDLINPVYTNTVTTLAPPQISQITSGALSYITVEETIEGWGFCDSMRRTIKGIPGGNVFIGFNRSYTGLRMQWVGVLEFNKTGLSGVVGAYLALIDDNLASISVIDADLGLYFKNSQQGSWEQEFDFIGYTLGATSANISKPASTSMKFDLNAAAIAALNNSSNIIRFLIGSREKCGVGITVYPKWMSAMPFGASRCTLNFTY